MTVTDTSSSPKAFHSNNTNHINSPILNCNNNKLMRQEHTYSNSNTTTTDSNSSNNNNITSNHNNNSNNNSLSNNTKISGMIAQSQPTTPHPEVANDESLLHQKLPMTSSFPINHSRVIVRGRANVFASESGPYFSPSKSLDNLFSQDKNPLSVRLQAKMDRGFFSADNDWTCYRRNYFQVSSVFSIHAFNHYYTVDDPYLFVKSGRDETMQPVHRFLIGISAKVENGSKDIELIQHTAKRDKGPQFKPSPKTIIPGGNLSLSTITNNQSLVTFERIQFKTATANNGKRRAAQQYYLCIVTLFAETDRGELIKVASCQSAPLVVRGRSPGHYADSAELHRAKAMNVQVPHVHYHPYPPSLNKVNKESATPQPNHLTRGLVSPNSTHGANTPVHESVYNHHEHTSDNNNNNNNSNNNNNNNNNSNSNNSNNNNSNSNNSNNSNNSHIHSPIYSKSVPSQQTEMIPPPPPPSNHHHPQGYSSYYYPSHYAHLPPSPMSHPPHPPPVYEQHPVPNYVPDHSNHYHSHESHSNTNTPKLQYGINEYQEWQRSRYNSSSSGSSSVPSPQQPEQPHYFSQHDQRSYSPATPTFVPLVAHTAPSSETKFSSNVPSLIK